MSQVKRQELRYQQIIRKITNTWIGSKILSFWNNFVKYYTLATWRNTKSVLWIMSTGAIIVLLPLALEATIEGEAQAQYLSSQLGGANQAQYRPY